MTSDTRIGVSFDFYKTLVEIDRDAPTIAEALTQLGYPCSPEIERIWNSNGFDGFQTHVEAETYDIWRHECLAELAQLCGAPASAAARIAQTLIALDSSWTVKRTSCATLLLESVITMGAQCCVLTNWDYPIAPYLEMADLPLSLPIISSRDIGARKPHPRMFAAAQELLKVPAKRHIHVGDDWNADVTGAVRSGAHALWLTEGGSDVVMCRAVTISNYTDAPDCLRELIRALKF